MKNSGVPISSFNPKVQEQIERLLHPEKPGAIASAAAAVVGAFLGPGAAPEKDRLRQNKKGPNKTEAAFALNLRQRFPGKKIHEQGVTLLLANGLRYTPDLFVEPVYPESDVDPEKAEAYEIKGFMRDDAAGKIKMAAKIHPWITFFLVTRRRKAAGGGWQIQEILK